MNSTNIFMTEGEKKLARENLLNLKKVMDEEDRNKLREANGISYAVKPVKTALFLQTASLIAFCVMSTLAAVSTTIGLNIFSLNRTVGIVCFMYALICGIMGAIAKKQSDY